MDERMRMNGGMYGMDGRNPYGGHGGYVMNNRGGGRSAYRKMRRNQRRAMNRGGYGMNMDMARMDRGMDGHYPQSQGSTYYPIQAMGTFEGYYGMPNQGDFARGNMGDYRGGDMGGYDMRGYDMRGGRNNDYGYPMQMPMMPYPNYPHMDFGYPYGDFGEVLSEQEMEEWKHLLMGELDEQERQMFSHEAIMQKIKQLGRPMQGFGEKELCLVTLMIYTDFKQDIGKNPDMAVRLAYDWLADKDVATKGAEKLSVYYDEIVKGGKDD